MPEHCVQCLTVQRNLLKLGICCDTFQAGTHCKRQSDYRFRCERDLHRFTFLLVAVLHGMQSDFFWLGRLLRLCQNIPEVHEELMLGANLQVA